MGSPAIGLDQQITVNMNCLRSIENGDNVKLLLVLLATIALPCHAQITFFSDSSGLPLGTANKVGNTTFYSDSNGLPIGTASQVGNTTFFSNSLGLPLGTANTLQPIPSGSQNSYNSPPAPAFPAAPLFPSSPRGW